MLIESGLPKYMWTYAVMSSAYIRNRCYNKDQVKDVFIGPKEFVSHMMMTQTKGQAIPPIEINL